MLEFFMLFFFLGLPTGAILQRGFEKWAGILDDGLYDRSWFDTTLMSLWVATPVGTFSWGLILSYFY
jgi:hypothetical protein